jgi:hypothetical protein
MWEPQHLTTYRLSWPLTGTALPFLPHKYQLGVLLISLSATMLNFLTKSPWIWLIKSVTQHASLYMAVIIGVTVVLHCVLPWLHTSVLWVSLQSLFSANLIHSTFILSSYFTLFTFSDSLIISILSYAGLTDYSYSNLHKTIPTLQSLITQLLEKLKVQFTVYSPIYGCCTEILKSSPHSDLLWQFGLLCAVC